MRTEATTLLKTKEVGWERTQIRSQFEATFGLDWPSFGPGESKLESRWPSLTNEAGMCFIFCGIEFTAPRPIPDLDLCPDLEYKALCFSLSWVA